MNIILAIHNNDTKMYAFDLGKLEIPNSGDYAIVQNRCGYDLVEIVMAGKIKIWHQQIVTGHQAVTQKVLGIIKRESMQDMERCVMEVSKYEREE